MMTRFVKAGLVMAVLAAAPLSTSDAQQRGREGRQNREQLEARFRTRLANLLRTQLGLNDEQMRQLSEVNQRFDLQRRAIIRREMGTRRSLREEVLKQDSADAGRIDQLIADQFRIERERIDLTEAEQRELGKFLTPSQRARYLGVQEQIRREMDQMRFRGGTPPDSGGARRKGRPPGS